jgi:acyl-CoA reductase-like NAD-dependent aldehyde dehydrogenase
MHSLISAFQEAGLPKGVLNSIVHDPADAASITSALISNPHVRKINFTGSTRVGRIISKLAGDQLKPVVMELGGKAPSIVWKDANLDHAADQCALGAFLNVGQICMSSERIIVHRDVAAEFKEKFKASVEKIFPSSSPAPVLINQASVDKHKSLMQNAVAKGASVIVGDLSFPETGLAVRPVVLDNVNKDMDIYATESFGPSVSLFEVNTEEEALELANDTEYGLSSAVFTEDFRTGLRFARNIDAGAVHINGMSVHDEAGLPHGGSKSSGHGRFNAGLGLSEWVKTKTVTFKTS